LLAIAFTVSGFVLMGMSWLERRRRDVLHGRYINRDDQNKNRSRLPALNAAVRPPTLIVRMGAESPGRRRWLI
jgi:hypothetical protein